MGIESSDEMADFLGRQYLSYGVIETLEEMLEHYRRVSLAEVAEVAALLKREQLYLFHVQ